MSQLLFLAVDSIIVVQAFTFGFLIGVILIAPACELVKAVRRPRLEVLARRHDSAWKTSEAH